MRTSQGEAGELVILKDDQWLKRQLIAGKCVSSILKKCEEIIASTPSNLSLKDLESEAEKIFKEFSCEATFHNYKGFPSLICASVNRGVVHGIVTDYVLRSGDLVSIDLGATYEGAIADAARTWIFGEPKSASHTRLLEVGRQALEKGQNAVKVGSRLGAIGNAIEKYVKKTEFGLITTYGGHGINYDKPHAQPFVSNKGSPTEGIRMASGLSIAIEPMIVIGEVKTKVESDGWTVTTPGLSCHFENSITIMNDTIYNITGY